MLKGYTNVSSRAHFEREIKVSDYENPLLAAAPIHFSHLATKLALKALKLLGLRQGPALTLKIVQRLTPKGVQPHMDLQVPALRGN